MLALRALLPGSFAALAQPGTLNPRPPKVDTGAWTPRPNTIQSAQGFLLKFKDYGSNMFEKY